MKITHELYFLNDLWLISHKYSFGTHDVWKNESCMLYYSLMKITHALYFLNDLWLICHKYSYDTHDVWIWIMFVKLLTHYILLMIYG